MNIALIGLGGMGTVHYMNYRHIPDVRVAGAVGASDADHARAAEWGVPIYDTLAALCEAMPIDLVDITTPTWLHKGLAAFGSGVVFLAGMGVAACMTASAWAVI